MFVIILSVVFCTTTNGNQHCDTKQPIQWLTDDHDVVIASLSECKTLQDAYSKLVAIRETDCFVKEMPSKEV